MPLPPLSIRACYVCAWKSFSKWWIPLCLVSGILMVFEVGPRQLLKAELSAIRQTFAEIKLTVAAGDMERTEELALELNERAMACAERLMKITLYAAPPVAILSVLLLSASLMAVKDRRSGSRLLQVVVVAAVHLLLAVVKVLLIFLILPLGMYLYVKLLFVSLLMLDHDQSPLAAIRGSWRMTAGSFWPLLGMVAINGTCLIALAPTVIGLIPGSAFANTARAAAFEMLKIRPDATAAV